MLGNDECTANHIHEQQWRYWFAESDKLVAGALSFDMLSLTHLNENSLECARHEEVINWLFLFERSPGHPTQRLKKRVVLWTVTPPKALKPG